MGFDIFSYASLKKEKGQDYKYDITALNICLNYIVCFQALLVCGHLRVRVVVFDRFWLIALKVSMCIKLVVCNQSGYQQLPAVSDLRRNSPGSL